MLRYFFNHKRQRNIKKHVASALSEQSRLQAQIFAYCFLDVGKPSYFQFFSPVARICICISICICSFMLPISDRIFLPLFLELICCRCFGNICMHELSSDFINLPHNSLFLSFLVFLIFLFPFVSSVRSSHSHPDLLVMHHPTPLFQITPVLNTGLSLSEPLQLYKGYNAI